jgi:hypothetical protein
VRIAADVKIYRMRQHRNLSGNEIIKYYRIISIVRDAKSWVRRKKKLGRSNGL